MLMFHPLSAMAAVPQTQTLIGIARPTASGLKINGSLLGDPDYDLSGTRGGKVSLSGEGSRLTARALYQKSVLDYQGSNFSVYTLLVDGMLELCACDELVFRPYVSTGMSYATIDFEALGRDGDDEGLILQFGAGVGIQLSPAVMIDARYRYIHPFDRRLHVYEMPVEMAIGTHNLLFGMRFSF
jgi:opacity protein-like surface antigen